MGGFYQSDKWQKARRTVLSERVSETGDLICEYCGRAIVSRYDAVVHHKIPLTDDNISDPEIAFNPDNLMIVHRTCHNRIHERFGYQHIKKVYVVWGSPCAGKDAYVRQIADDRDIVISIDRLYSTVGNRKYSKEVVLDAYDRMIDTVRTRRGKWNNAYIVRTLPLEIDRERLSKQLDAELIHVDTPESVCMAEAQRRGGEWPEWVSGYWSMHIPPTPRPGGYGWGTAGRVPFCTARNFLNFFKKFCDT